MVEDREIMAQLKETFDYTLLEWIENGEVKYTTEEAKVWHSTNAQNAARQAPKNK
jgi:hypothetical protein